MNDQLQELIRELHQAREYRPVNVSILYRIVEGKIKFLLTQPRNAPDIWSFPQGGIKLEETIEESLARELSEELGIDSTKDLTQIIYGFHYKKLDFEGTRKDKRNFTKGKAYLFSLAQYIGDGNLVLRDKEVIGVTWEEYENAIKLLNKTRPEKSELSRTAIYTARWMLS